MPKKARAVLSNKNCVIKRKKYIRSKIRTRRVKNKKKYAHIILYTSYIFYIQRRMIFLFVIFFPTLLFLISTPVSNMTI